MGPLGDGDPKCKCKKVSGTKTELNYSGTKIPVELKIAAELKLGGNPWVTVTLGECKKVSGTKTELNSSRTKIPAKLKNCSGTKIGGGTLG